MDPQVSFVAIKNALVAVVPLAHLLPHAELLLATNVSDTHIGGVLQQREIGSHLASSPRSCPLQSVLKH